MSSLRLPAVFVALASPLVVACAEVDHQPAATATFDSHVAAEAVQASAPVRREHARIRARIEEARAVVAAIPAGDPPAQRREMAEVLAFFDTFVGPHAAWEERVLYPAVDEHAASPPGYSFTATMRDQHWIIGQRVGDLRTLAGDRAAAAFSRRADALLGLVTAHLESEEEVLLPILDRTMTPEEFRREILDDGAATAP